MSHDSDSDHQAGDHQAGDDPAAERAGIHNKPSDEEIKEIEEEREERLAPENRPENAEVDNTDKKIVDGHLIDRDADVSEEPAADD